MEQLENVRFTNLLRDAIQEAVKLGYPPNEFRKMLDRDGGYETVKRIVAKRDPSDGFFRLYQLKSVKLTCEAIIVETEWRRFFDQDLLEIAEKRLRDFGYAFTPFVGAPSPSAIGPASSAPDVEPQPEDGFNPPEEDGRERELRRVVTRPGQGAFRDDLFQRYGVRCCISGCQVADALEAAHIASYRGEASDHLQNGLLLRADLHTLFDRYLLSINPTSLEVVVFDALRLDATYGQFDGAALLFDGSCRPSTRALEVHWSTFLSASN